MKYPVIYCGGKQLKELSITQDEHDYPYWNGQPQQALDFGWGVFGDYNVFLRSPITCDRDVTITSVGGSNVNDRYITFNINGTDYSFLIGHPENTPPVGKIIKAGDTICFPGNPNGGPHIHICSQYGGKTFSIREIVFNNVEESAFHKGEKANFVAVTNIRDNYGLQAKVLTTTVGGAVCQILSDAYFANGYEWHEVKFLDIKGWSYTGNMNHTDKNITNVDGTTPETCEIKLSRAIKEKEALQKELEKTKLEFESMKVKIREIVK